MPRVCFQLQVRPELIAEYRARHHPVRREMLDEIAASGRRNYSLFLRDDGLLIGYFETDDLSASQHYLSTSRIAATWEAEMAPFFVALDSRADQSMSTLDEVFNLADQLDGDRLS